MMRVFGITGGIGSGKSTVSRMLRGAGVPIMDADELARRVVEPGTEGLEAVVREFGRQALDEEGRLDRKRMGELVFSSVAMRAKLNSILHPAIGRMAREELARLEAEGSPLAGYDCPLLFESGLHAEYRPAVVVFSTVEQQVARIMARNGLSEPEARARVGAQMPLAEKVRMADLVVENTGTEEELRDRVVGLMEEVARFRP